jgi:hypothetical protein
MKRRISPQVCWMTTSSSLSVTRLSSQARIGGHGSGSSSQLASDVPPPPRRTPGIRAGCWSQAVGAVQARLGDFAGGIEARRVGAAVEVHHHAAAGVMLRRHDRDRLPGDVDAEPSSFS